MSKKKVLLVDDDQMIAKFVKMALEDTDEYEVTLETNGANGFSKVKEIQPDLVLLDLNIAGTDGSEIASQIREDENIKDTPIVFMTGGVMQEEVDQQGGKIGGHAFIAKPASVDTIVATVKANVR